MAKYSQHLRSGRVSNTERPKIFKSVYGEWVLLRSKNADLNFFADIFCQKLNNAAPKRGLKA